MTQTQTITGIKVIILRKPACDDSGKRVIAKGPSLLQCLHITLLEKLRRPTLMEIFYGKQASLIPCFSSVSIHERSFLWKETSEIKQSHSVQTFIFFIYAQQPSTETRKNQIFLTQYVKQNSFARKRPFLDKKFKCSFHLNGWSESSDPHGRKDTFYFAFIYFSLEIFKDLLLSRFFDFLIFLGFSY